MDRLDRVVVTGAATAEAIAPNDVEDSFPSSQINRNTKIVDATTNIISSSRRCCVCGDLSPPESPRFWRTHSVSKQTTEPSWHEDDKASRAAAAALS